MDVESLDISGQSRFLLFAPHPDDEALATGGLLQRAAAVGAQLCIAFATDGENNPWPQRAIERRWSIGPHERARWGGRRRVESVHALRTLGLGPAHAHFLGFPDQHLTALLAAGDRELEVAIAELLRSVAPTHVVGPSPLDHHPDHSALAIAVRTSIVNHVRGPRPRLLEYLVHDGRQRALARPVRIRLTPAEQARKREAIACHTSQLLFRRDELLAFAQQDETFHVALPGVAHEAAHPIRGIERNGDRVAIHVRRTPCARAFGPASIHLLFPAFHGVRRLIRVALPWRSRTTPILFADGRAYPLAAEYRGGLWRGVLHLPASALPSPIEGYAKLEARYGFFDEAGWRSLPRQRARRGRGESRARVRQEASRSATP